jgi:peptide/nickel transport system ATP-binding protein
VGESGSGKSTLGRLLLGLERPDAGEVLFRGAPMPPCPSPAWRALRRKIQPVYQDPSAVLNPAWTIRDLLEEPLRIHQPGLARAARATAVLDLLDQVGLPAATLSRLPAELSGGQKQRVVIARALALEPELLFADEPVSALDLSVQAQILNLLLDLRARRRMAMLFVSHNIEVVRHMTDRTLVLDQGVFVEEGASREVFDHPVHPFTQALVRALPKLP